MRIKTMAAAGAATALLIGGVALAPALATPPSSPGPGPVDDDVVAPVVAVLDGSTDGPNKVSADGIELKTKRSTTIRSFDLGYPAGSHSGWHSHPGIVIAVVEEGTVVRQVGCTTETFTVGEAFTEVGPHFISNPSTEEAVLAITQIYPTGSDPLRVDEPAPDCD